MYVQVKCSILEYRMKTKLILLTLSISALSLGATAQPKSKAVAVPTKNLYAIRSSDTSDLLMNEHRFWGLIMEARAGTKNNYKAQIMNLKRLLFNLEPQEIEQFDNRFMAMMDVAYDNRLWAAASVINGGCSEDCFDFFRQYLISQGKERFYATLKDPESCSTWIKSETEEDWEGLLYVAAQMYRMKTGKEIPASYQPVFALKGEPFNDDSALKQYPKLAKKFITKN